jgi:hypothetical protein
MEAKLGIPSSDEGATVAASATLRWRPVLRSIALLFPAAIIVALNVWSCSSSPSAKIALLGVTRFRAEMEASQFQEMYADGDELLRTKHNEEDFVRLMAAFQKALGPPQNTRLTRARESWFWSKDKHVTLCYKTTWAKGEGAESFVFLIRDGRPILDSYVITEDYPPLSAR